MRRSDGAAAERRDWEWGRGARAAGVERRPVRWMAMGSYGRLGRIWTFLRLWCVRRKPCPYLALKLTLFLNRPKRESIRHTSSRSSTVCIQIDFQANGMFHANRAPILHQD
jgi:hypothetical protein